MLTLLKVLLINTLEILVAALTGGLLIALGDYCMPHRTHADLPEWRDFLGRALYYAAILWFHIYATAIFVLFLIVEVITRLANLSFTAILVISIILFALIASTIWDEAYSYSGIDKSEKRLKNTLSLLLAGVPFAAYTQWLLRKRWTNFSIEEDVI